MLRRLLLIWLVISTIGYGSVWALDGHLDAAQAHHGVAGAADVASGDGGDHPACDHCCHAAAHIVAFWPAQTALLPAPTAAGDTPYRRDVAFLPASPPEYPPRT